MKEVPFEQAGPRVPVEAPLVFIHIPKSAGTTLGAVLVHHYGDTFLKVSTKGAVDAEGMRKCVEAAWERPATAAFQGHIPCGLSDLFPADARFMTLLRDPVERTLSHYHEVVTSASRWHPDWVFRQHATRPPPSPELTLAECLQPRGYVPDNMQTRMLCGLVSPWDELPPAALEQAKRNLAERFAYVGTTERVDEFVSLLNIELGWPTLPYKAKHTSSGRPRADDLSPAELRLVEEANLLDRQLHAYAGELLAEALERAGPELERELEVFERAERRARDRATVPLRSLPLETRVELALKERELARARADCRKLRRRLAHLRERADRLKRALESPDVLAR